MIAGSILRGRALGPTEKLIGAWQSRAPAKAGRHFWPCLRRPRPSGCSHRCRRRGRICNSPGSLWCRPTSGRRACAQSASNSSRARPSASLDLRFEQVDDRPDARGHLAAGRGLGTGSIPPSLTTTATTSAATSASQAPHRPTWEDARFGPLPVHRSDVVVAQRRAHRAVKGEGVIKDQSDDDADDEGRDLPASIWFDLFGVGPFMLAAWFLGAWLPPLF